MAATEPAPTAVAEEHLDVLIVGAGISGVSMAHHLQTEAPGRRYAILEARDDLGGTWDLFRYPGIRSDSDMFTLGFGFKPWKGRRTIADGPSILAYIREAAAERGIDRHIRFGHRVTKVAWDSASATWTVEATRKDGSTTTLTAGFVVMAAGYYRYDEGHTPPFPGLERYQGQVVHPQHWDGVEVEGRRFVVIGSGATAVTLVPALADEGAAHVTMLQRTPSYILALPGVDPTSVFLRKVLPEKPADRIIRWKNVLTTMAIYGLARHAPGVMKKLLRAQTKSMVGDRLDVDVHFKPPYDPWDQRLCLVPDADLFKALKRGRAEVVTDHVDTFTEGGIRLQSGRELEADVVVTATGLELQFAGGAALEVDGEPVVLKDRLTYKGVMLEGVPNFAVIFGYTNASWTLRADLVASYVCRLLEHLRTTGNAVAVPRPQGVRAAANFVDLESNYVKRAVDRFPKQGDRWPWTIRQNYLADLRPYKKGPVAEDLELRPAPARDAGKVAA